MDTDHGIHHVTCTCCCCNGAVTVEKHPCFCFLFRGPGPSDPASERPLTERSITLGPVAHTISGTLIFIFQRTGQAWLTSTSAPESAGVAGNGRSASRALNKTFQRSVVSSHFCPDYSRDEPNPTRKETRRRPARASASTASPLTTKSQ